uniref:Uncharacterized protein n=1 Tax=Panagrolaimus sp. PS1159 TaxID=55785 RepID=A0AC35GLK6_9BILA
MQKASGKLPQDYLKQLQNKEVGANGAIKKPRLAITDSFPLPTSSDRASIGKQSEGRIGAFDIKGTVKI